MRSAFLLVATTAAFIGLQARAQAQLFSVGSAQNFAVLAGSTVTNTGPSVISGDLGVSPNTAVTGFLPGIVTPPGTIHLGDEVALQAQKDVTTSYNVLAALAHTQDLSGQDLAGKTLHAGVYHFSSAAALNGTLTLDGLGDPNALFVFHIESTLTTGSAAAVVTTDGNDGNIFW